MQHKLNTTLHVADNFVDTCSVASQPLDIGAVNVTLPREPSKAVVPELQVNSMKVEKHPKIDNPSKQDVAKSKHGGGSMMCCGSNPKKRHA